MFCALKKQYFLENRFGKLAIEVSKKNIYKWLGVRPNVAKCSLACTRNLESYASRASRPAAAWTFLISWIFFTPDYALLNSESTTRSGGGLFFRQPTNLDLFQPNVRKYLKNIQKYTSLRLVLWKFCKTHWLPASIWDLSQFRQISVKCSKENYRFYPI